MAELTDHELLTRFARTGEEAAFATLVTRHVNLVWSAARRFTGDDTLASEVTQAVFIILAQKAGRLSAQTVLTGWLYQTARLTAANALKENRRRQQREHQAYMEATLTPNETNEAWQQLAPVLDEAMHALRTADRDAVLLRFFENKSLADVGAALGVTEDAARVRVNRALNKLRALLAKQGIKFGATAIATAVVENSVQAAPMALAAKVSVIAAKGAATTSAITTLVKGTLKIMAWTKAQTAIVVGITILLAVGTATVVIEKSKVREFSYQGKPLSVWLKEYDNTEEVFANNGKKLHELDKIVNQAGSNAIPTLLQLLRDEDSKGHDFRSNGNEVSNGFRVLGASATNAVSSLINIYEQNPAARVDILYSLNCIGTNADVPIDWLLPKLKDADPQVRAGIAYVLGNMHTKSDQCIPALIECLSDSNRMVRGDTALALGACGADAKPAIPKLVEMLKDKEKGVRRSVALALTEIDPETAIKSGIQ